MTKQFGRNPDACDAIAAAGIEAAVAVDIQCMEAVLRSPHAHRPRGSPRPATPRFRGRHHRRPSGGRDGLRRGGRRASRRGGHASGRDQPVLLRVVAPGDRFYFGHGGGLPLEGIEAAAHRIDAISGLRVAGVTRFPALLADPETRQPQADAELATILRAAERLRRPGSTSSRSTRQARPRPGPSSCWLRQAPPMPSRATASTARRL